MLSNNLLSAKSGFSMLSIILKDCNKYIIALISFYKKAKAALKAFIY